LISSTGTLSDEALAISIKTFSLPVNLDNKFVPSFQRNIANNILVEMLAK
jgi:hypothetical protein